MEQAYAYIFKEETDLKTDLTCDDANYQSHLGGFPVRSSSLPPLFAYLDPPSILFEQVINVHLTRLARLLDPRSPA